MVLAGPIHRMPSDGIAAVDVPATRYGKTAELIRVLVAEARADLPNLQPRTDVKDILEVHLQGEHEVITLYEQARRVAEAPQVRKLLEGMKHDEGAHQRLLRAALAHLLP